MIRGIATAVAAVLVLGVGAPGAAWADGGPRTGRAPPAVQPVPPQQFGQTGEVRLPNSALTLFVPANYYYLPAGEARAYLQRIGAPQPSGDILGMVAPANMRPIDPGFWGAVVSVNPLGRVAEERADRLAAPDLADEVRTSRPSTPRLEAFVSAPTHDASRHVTTWVERYPAAGARSRPLRYEQRLLGRSQVAAVTIDARADQQATVAGAAPAILGMLRFAPGQGYGDYIPGRDPAPAYDLPGLLTLKPKPAQTAATTPTPPVAEPVPAPVTEPVTTATAPGNGATGIPAGLGEPATAEVAGEAGGQPVAGMAGLGRWMPWIGAGLVALGLIPWLVSLARRGRDREARDDYRRGDRDEERDPNLMPGDDNRPA